MQRTHGRWLSGMPVAVAVLLVLAGCRSEEEWPDHSDLVETYGTPTAPLDKGTFEAVWTELTDVSDLFGRLGDVPGLGERLGQALGGPGGPLEQEHLAVTVTSTTKVPCPKGGQMVIETRGEEGPLVEQARFRAQKCAYDVTLGGVVIRQTLSGDLYLSTFSGGRYLLVLEAAMTIGEEQADVSVDFLFQSKRWKFRLETGDTHVIVALDPEAGLKGVLNFEASNGDFECLLDNASLVCTNLGTKEQVKFELP